MWTNTVSNKLRITETQKSGGSDGALLSVSCVRGERASLLSRLVSDADSFLHVFLRNLKVPMVAMRQRKAAANK